MPQRSGVMTTGQQSTEGRAVRAVGPIIHELEIDKAPLTVIMTKASGRLVPSGNTKVEWIEDTLPAQFDVLGANLTAGATTMVVTNYDYFCAGMLVQINRKEIVRVTATPTTTTVAIARAVGEESAAAATQNDQLFIIGDSSEEGTDTSPILMPTKTNPYNYMEITKTDIGWTGTAKASEVYGKSDPDVDRVKAIVKHARELEKKYIVGQRYYTASGAISSKAHRTMRGVMTWISTNYQAMGGEMTQEEFENHLRKVFRYGSNKKLLVASGKVISVINSFAQSKVTPAEFNSTYGLKLSKYITPFGDLDIAYSPLLENASLDDFNGLAGTGIILDIANLEVHHLPNRYMVHMMDTQDPGVDGEQEEILSECTIKVAQEKMHSYFDGVTE